MAIKKKKIIRKPVAKKTSRNTSRRDVMEFTPAKKTVRKTSVKKSAARKSVAKPILKSLKPTEPAVITINKPKSSFRSSRLALILYWAIVVGFVGATLYLVGNGKPHGTGTGGDVAQVSEMTPDARAEFATAKMASGSDKLTAGDTTGAVADFTDAIAADNTRVAAFIYRGEALMQSGNFALAIADFDTATELDPTNPVTLYDRALAKSRIEDTIGAIDDVTMAIAALSERGSEVISISELYAFRGELNLWSKNFAGAIEDYTLALTGEPNSFDILGGRAEAYTALSQFQNAIDDYAAAIGEIANQIESEPDLAVRETMSARAMNYFEKSGAVRITLGDMAGARVDLEAANTLATAMNDYDSATRLRQLIAELPE